MRKNLEERKLDAIDKARYSAVAAELSGDRLGLPEVIYERLLTETELVVHVSHL